MRRGIAGAVFALGLLVTPSIASADHHFMVIREVSPETTAGANDGFVELQMYAAGQNLVGGHAVSFYSASGVNGAQAAFVTDVDNGQNQRTVLVGDTAVAGADLVYAAMSDELVGTGGAVCFDSATFGTIDCVAWGPFTGSTDSPTGTPAVAVTAGQSLTRSVAPGCATLLEASDDTDDSATDFALGGRTPRPNSVAPTETACGPGGGGGDNNPPQTEITKGPKKKIEKPKAKFKFTSSEPNSSFECKLDKRAFKRCDSPEKVKGLDDGKHKFSVRATDNAGNTDPTPAKLRFRVV